MAHEPKTLDPQLMTGEPEGRVAEAIFEGLTRLDARSLEPVPGVAESWDIAPDGKTYTFHLRGDARWSDGHRGHRAGFHVRLAPLAGSGARLRVRLRHAHGALRGRASTRTKTQADRARWPDTAEAVSELLRDLSRADPRGFGA